MGFMGYPRADGRVGVRNHIVVMSSVNCCNAVVEQIGRAVPEVTSCIPRKVVYRPFEAAQPLWGTPSFVL